MNKIIYIFALLILSSNLWADNVVIKKAENAVTFVVDGDLPKPKQELRYLSGDMITRALVQHENVPQDDGTRIIAYSFEGDSLIYRGNDNLFEVFRTAYADHRPIVLSPDDIWLIISQGFARYVNAHAEEMRPMLVSHEGKRDLSITTQKDLLTEKADWGKLLEDFSEKIRKNTKGDLANIITGDFSTTDAVKRIASQVVVMDVFKQYFNYQVLYVVCGIPYITLKGTPDDWRKVLNKAQKLMEYDGIAPWIAKLEPILKEFVTASECSPNQQFWQNIVRKKRVGELRGGGCSFDRPTTFDGWFLNLFPNKEGQVADSISHDYRYMPSEMVRVPFKYKKVGAKGDVLSETPMELWAGFVGMKEDKETKALIPQIGWMVRTSNESEELIRKFYNADSYYEGIKLTGINEVPIELTQLEHIKYLSLEFEGGKVVLPEWFTSLQIDQLDIKGEMSAEEKEGLCTKMPNTKITVSK